MGAKKARKAKQTVDEETLTLLSHVRELQLRLLVTGVVLVGAGVVAYLYYGQILDLLRKPLNAPLYISSVSGSFAFIMKICLVAGIAVSVPLIIYNFVMFVRPAFPEVFTRKRVFLMTSGSVVAAALGALFGYFFIIPGAIHFFGGFQVHGLHEMIQADGYLNFVVNVLVTFILMFQLPIVASLIDRIRPISPRMLWKGEKWALIGSVIISLVVPFAMDFTTQLLIAAPIFILYNLSFVVIAFQHAYGNKVAKGVQRKAARVEAKVAKKAERAVSKRKAVPAPALSTPSTALAPNPQLAETFELLAKQASKAPAVTAKLAVKPVTMQPKPQPVQHAFKPAPSQPARVISMDGMSARPHRTQPAQIIRTAGTIHKAPERPAYRSPRAMNLMADIR